MPETIKVTTIIYEQNDGKIIASKIRREGKARELNLDEITKNSEEAVLPEIKINQTPVK